MGTRVEKVLIWACLFVNRARGVFLSVYVGRYQTGRQDRERRADLENSHAKR